MRLFNIPAGEVHELRFAPDGRSIYLLSWEVWEPGRGFSALGDMFLYQHAYRADIRSGEVTGAWPFRGSEVATFAPDLCSVYYSVSVAVSGGELDVRRTDLATGQSTIVYQANVPYPSRFAFTPNGHILSVAGMHYSGDGRECVHRLDVWHRKELEPIPDPTLCLAYSPNGRLLATGGRESVCVWEGRKPVARWPGAARHLAWVSDERFVWVGNGALSVAYPGDPEVRTWAVSRGFPSALAVSGCGRFLATGSERGCCSLHDLATTSVRETFDWGIGSIHSVAFAPDGLTCAAGGENGQVVVWDVDG